jgi:hypothetical protein
VNNLRVESDIEIRDDLGEARSQILSVLMFDDVGKIERSRAACPRLQSMSLMRWRRG